MSGSLDIRKLLWQDDDSMPRHSTDVPAQRNGRDHSRVIPFKFTTNMGRVTSRNLRTVNICGLSSSVSVLERRPVA